MAYLTAKICASTLKIKLNLPLVFLLGLIPDIDLLIPGLQHRGLTHSIIILTIAFIPAFAIYKKTAIPYFAALMHHILIGDFLTSEGTQLLWPITQTWYGLGVSMTSLTNVLLEWISFLMAGAIMLSTRDMQKLLKSDQSNLLLSIPILTVLLPSLLHFPLKVPLSLLIPHLIYLGLFTASLLIFLKSSQQLFTQNVRQRQSSINNENKFHKKEDKRNHLTTPHTKRNLYKARKGVAAKILSRLLLCASYHYVKAEIYNPTYA